MRRSKFSPDQIARILKEFDNGKSVEEISRDHGVSTATFYKWRSKYAGMNSTELKKLKQLEEENAKLKQMYDNSTNLPVVNSIRLPLTVILE